MEQFVLITRAQIDASDIAEEIFRKDHKVLCEPLIEIIYHQKSFSLSNNDYAGLIFTSVNGVRAFVQNSDSRDLVVFTVGDRTRDEATQAGFKIVESASGDVEALVALLQDQKADRPYLYIRGEHISKPLVGAVDGLSIEEIILYHTEKKEEISTECLRCIKQGRFSNVLFFSKRTAESFVDYVVKHGLEAGLRSSKALCLGESMVEYVSQLPWQEVRVATRPDREGMLALLE